MTRRIAVILLSVISASFAGCGFFDSSTVWRGGPYALMWIDLPHAPYVARYEGKGAWSSRISEQVFAVGWDGRYLVAKQHPKGENTITHFFILDSQKDGPRQGSAACVIGPLSEQEFQAKKVELSLPEFSKTLESLK